MKKGLLLLVITMFMSFLSVNAQEAGKFRGGLDLGYAIPKGGGGIGAALELKYNLKDNMNVGLRIEDAFMAKEVSNEEGSVSGNEAYLATFDYYFNKGTSNFAPFVGAGAGYYSLATIKVGNSELGADASGKFGGLLRAGFEYSRFRLAASYNLVPSSKIDMGQLGKISSTNGYFLVTVGFYLGGGSWKK
ncbi:hypothetical protein [Dysgonomonas reticulitermitis]